MHRYLPYADSVDPMYLAKARALLYSELNQSTEASSTLHPRVVALAANINVEAPSTVGMTQKGNETSTLAASSSFTPEQRRAIQLEYQRGERVRSMAVAEAAPLAVTERVEMLDSLGRALCRRRVEVTRSTEDLNARRKLLQTDVAFAEKMLNDEK